MLSKFKGESTIETTTNPLCAIMTILDRAAEELLVTDLSDEQILSLMKLQMDKASQAELSELLAQNREDSLDVSNGQRLDQLIGIYRYNMVRKAKVFKVATERGLILSL